MKLSLFLFFLVIAFSCRPHYDFSEVRSEIKSEVKSDSLVYQTGFNANDTSWYKTKAGNAISTIENQDLIINVDTVKRLLEEHAPCGSLRYPYSVFTKVKISLQDSTGIGYAGLCFDRIDSSYYRMLFISNKGTFFLKDMCNGEEEVLIPKINSRYLVKGTNVYNTIELRHRKKEVRILFNGNVAAICKLKGAFSYGEIGVVASTTENRIHYSPVKAVFESFMLKKIKAE